MKKIIPILVIIVLSAEMAFAQTSILFYNGGIPADMYTWPWGFGEDPAPAPLTGYTPGTAALKWATHSSGSQGLFIGFSSNTGVDLTASWETDSVYFKMKAPNGLAASDSMYVWIYDSRNADWNNALKYKFDELHDLADGGWHQFSIALKDFIINVEDINKTDIVAVSFETETGIASEILIDKVWIGHPKLSITMTIFDGQALVPGIEHEAWGFDNNDLVLVPGEGWLPGTPAILWESSNWEWQGHGFKFNVHDFSHSMTVDTMKIKIKAPAGINDLALEFYDVYYYDTYLTAKIVLDENIVTWDGDWKALEIPLADFTVPEGFDLTQIYELGVTAASATIPERLLLDDIWIGYPYIETDMTPPEPPANVTVTSDENTPFVNFIVWEDVEAEYGETYTVYASEKPITDLTAPEVFVLVADVPEGENLAVHSLYSPLKESELTYYYAIICTDAASNVSETFTTSAAFTNTGRAYPIINYGAPANFVADGYFDEWAGIVPFNIKPETNPVVAGSIDDSLDLNVNCYLAMDQENLYVAFDIIDDVFAWQATNTTDWWNDESIEFFIGLYNIVGTVSHHNYWGRGAEPDYRIVFMPTMLTIDAWPGLDSLMAGTEDYFFESGGAADYFIEAKIPLDVLTGVSDDSAFTPVEGMKVPLEIQVNDADVVNGGEVARIQFGDNSTADGWWNNPDIWTFTWVGLPEPTSVEHNNNLQVAFYTLSDNFPNPFNPSTTINYSLAHNGVVELNIYNTLGQKVRTLVNKHQKSGLHTVNFDATDLASGIYFYKLSAKDFSQVKKMILIK
ncbi:T9SS type A sorting domain-containing protein [candidate division KSB1 bacterium]|nr:T9SS type A sorting domain-containing protein [candidate division KSB1 bacterium]